MPDGKSVVLAGNGPKIQLWDLETLAFTESMGVDVVFALATSPGGLIASGHNNKTVKLWDSRLNKKTEVAAHDDRVTALAFKDSTLLASGSANGQVRLWEITTAGARLRSRRRARRTAPTRRS